MRYRLAVQTATASWSCLMSGRKVFQIPVLPFNQNNRLCW